MCLRYSCFIFIPFFVRQRGEIEQMNLIGWNNCNSLYLLKPDGVLIRVDCQTAGTFDHADIIGSVSYSQCDGLLVLLDQLHHLSLLQRSDPAADYRLAHARRLQKLQLHALIQGIRLRWESHNRFEYQHLHTEGFSPGLWPEREASELPEAYQAVSIDNQSILSICHLVCDCFHAPFRQKHWILCCVWFHGGPCIPVPQREIGVCLNTEIWLKIFHNEFLKMTVWPQILSYFLGRVAWDDEDVIHLLAK